MNAHRKLIVCGGLLLACGAWLALSNFGQADAPADNQPAANSPAPDAHALERTRKTVRMLDDLYKTAVVLITKHYVNLESDLPAGTAAIALFDAMRQKGWHDVRLLDATGQPYEAKNAPRDDFEKTAVARLKSGSTYYEQIVHRDGRTLLRAATPIPVVLQKCTMCHPHYKDAKAGEPIGILSYTLPIE
jgi:hypothetical protein